VSLASWHRPAPRPPHADLMIKGGVYDGATTVVTVCELRPLSLTQQHAQQIGEWDAGLGGLDEMLS
jgi:hypothetical protein